MKRLSLVLPLVLLCGLAGKAHATKITATDPSPVDIQNIDGNAYNGDPTNQNNYNIPGLMAGQTTVSIVANTPGDEFGPCGPDSSGYSYGAAGDYCFFVQNQTHTTLTNFSFTLTLPMGDTLDSPSGNNGFNPVSLTPEAGNSYLVTFTGSVSNNGVIVIDLTPEAADTTPINGSNISGNEVDTAVTPEPSTLILLSSGMGFFGLYAFGRRRGVSFGSQA